MKRHAFTLIEIIIVTAIVAVLIAIAVPVLGHVRESARRAACLANLKTFGQAFAAYRASNNDLWPIATNGIDVRVGRLAPLDALAAHMDAPLPKFDNGRVVVQSPFACPSDRRVAADIGCSYVYIPTTDMASMVSRADAAGAIASYSRTIGENPTTLILTEASLFHGPPANNLYADGSAR